MSHFAGIRYNVFEHIDKAESNVILSSNLAARTLLLLLLGLREQPILQDVHFHLICSNFLLNL